MIVIKRFQNEKDVEGFKEKILEQTYEITKDDPCRLGIYSKIRKNFIVLKNVSEIRTSGGSPIHMYFFGFFICILKKHFLIGAITPIIITMIISIISYISNFNIIIETLVLGTFFYLISLSDIREIKEFIERCLGQH